MWVEISLDYRYIYARKEVNTPIRQQSPKKKG